MEGGGKWGGEHRDSGQFSSASSPWGELVQCQALHRGRGHRDDRGVDPAPEDSQSSGSGKGQGRGVPGLGFVFYFRGKVAIFITKG